MVNITTTINEKLKEYIQANTDIKFNAALDLGLRMMLKDLKLKYPKL